MNKYRLIEEEKINLIYVGTSAIDLVFKIQRKFLFFWWKTIETNERFPMKVYKIAWSNPANPDNQEHMRRVALETTKWENAVKSLNQK